MSDHSIWNVGTGPATSVPTQEVRLTTGEPCLVHGIHKPNSHVNEVHHVWPKGEGGPNIAENRIVVCATGHNSIHQLIDEYKTMQGKVPYSVLKQYTMNERAYALLGYQRIVRGAM